MSLRTLKARIRYAGGDQLNRIKVQKYRSFQAALKNDYNSRRIRIHKNNQDWQCLINTENIKTDYTKQYLSIDYESHLEGGDTFVTLDTGEVWMCYLQDFVETAYYHTDIIKCRYTLEINHHTYWIYFQGPTETDVRWNKQRNKNYNELNLSGTIYIKNTPETKKFFDRFTKIKLDGHNWEVQVTDSISVPGIIELEIQEDYDNIAEDLPEIKKAKPYFWQDELEVEEIIMGKDMIRQCEEVGYKIQPSFYKDYFHWSIIGNKGVKILEEMEDGHIVKIEAKPESAGTFTLRYGDDKTFYDKEVEIDLYRPKIHGPETVYPYSVNDYHVYNMAGDFYVDSPLARIISHESNNCKVEITSSKKGKFILMFDSDKDEHVELPITIGSL